MKSRITEVFAKGPAYIAYLTAGDGGMERSFNALMALVAGGVDILEVGVPFSDPVADGPVIQAAATRALAQQVTMQDILELVAKLRAATTTPIILFSYYNPIFIANQQQDFFAKARAAGVDGCLVVDIPYEESANYQQQCSAAGIDPIFVVAPSSSLARIEKIHQQAQGMLYYACRKGTTGVKTQLPIDLQQRLAEIKTVATLPVVAGFGIADQATAHEVLQHADGFVVGSKFVDAVANGMSEADLTALAKAIDPRQTDLQP